MVGFSVITYWYYRFTAMPIGEGILKFSEHWAQLGPKWLIV